MKYVILGDGGQYVEDNFAIVVINVSGFGLLDNMVVLKKRSMVHYKLDIENKDAIVIVDRHASFLTRNMELVKIKEEDIDCEYLFYLSQHELDGTKKVPEKDVSNCCSQPVIENTDLCSVCKEHSEVKYGNRKKEEWKRDDKIKSLIASVSNVCFDTFDVIESRDEAGLITFLADNGIHTFKKAVILIKEFIEPYGYRLLPRSNVYVDFDNTSKTEDLSDSVGKFFIIKDEEKFINKLTVKPITVYAVADDVGYIIGNQGTNIKRLVRDFNHTNKHWVVPYINVKRVDERTTNNSSVDLNNKYYELLKIIFKNKNKDHEFWHKRG